LTPSPLPRLQKENRNLMEKMEMLEREYGKVRKVVEFVMPLIENMDEDFRRKIFEKTKEQIIIGNHLKPHGVIAEN
jgi:hypothetical protein